MNTVDDAVEGGIYTPMWDVLKSTAMRVHVVFYQPPDVVIKTETLYITLKLKALCKTWNGMDGIDWNGAHFDFENYFRNNSSLNHSNGKTYRSL